MLALRIYFKTGVLLSTEAALFTQNWRLGDLETWRLGDLETWRLGDLVIYNKREVVWVLHYCCGITKSVTEQIELKKAAYSLV